MLSAKQLNLLVVRQTAESNRDSTFALFKQIIFKWKLDKHFIIRESDLKITCKLNNNCVLFKGLEDTERLKSITFPKGELGRVWIEEASEVDRNSLSQLDVRLRGGTSHKEIIRKLT